MEKTHSTYINICLVVASSDMKRVDALGQLLRLRVWTLMSGQQIFL